MSYPPLPSGFVLDAPVQPSQQAMGRDPNAVAPQALAAGRQADAAPPLQGGAGIGLPEGYQEDTSGTQTVGGFADELPQQPISRMSAEDEAHVVAMLHDPATTAHDVRAFAASKGFNFTSAEQVIADRRKTGRINPDAVYELPKVADQGAAHALGAGAADTITMGTAPKLDALGAGLKSAIDGNGFTDAYNRRLDENNALGASDEENHPWARVAGQLLGGLVLPSGMEGVGLKVGTDVLKAGGTMTEARVAAKIAVRNRMAAVGGGYGAAHGAGSADTLGDAASGAAIEGTLGAATGGLIGQLGRETRAAAPVITEGQRVGAAAARQGLDVLPADVGGPTVRRATGAAAQMPFAVGRITEASQHVGSQAQAARDRIAATIGTALTPEQMGQTALAGAQKYISSSGAAKDAMYRAAEGAAGTTKVAATKAVAELDTHIAELGETPGGAPGLTTLQGLRDSLAAGDVSVGGLRRMRSVLRDQFVKDGLRGSDIERRVNGVLDAARSDVTDGLTAAGKGGAATLFARADRAYAERARTIDTVLKPLIGSRDVPKSGEAIAKGLMADLQGNNARSVAFLRALPTDEQANTRASIIGRMGHVSAGADNPEGDAFSLPAFLTSWNKIGETAKRAYFGDEARAALNDIATVANGTKLAQRYANHSNTAGGLEFGRLLSYVTALPTFGGALGGQMILGRLLASPRFARWLARAPKTSLGTAAYADRLTRIARAEPAIANEVLQLQRRLTDAFTSSPTRLAADESLNGGNQVNGQDRQGEERQDQPVGSPR